MYNPTNKLQFNESDDGIVAEQLLLSMVADEAYRTESSYTPNAVLYPDNLISFVDKHMQYLRIHPTTNPRHYISNLRLMLRIK